MNTVWEKMNFFQKRAFKTAHYDNLISLFEKFPADKSNSDLNDVRTKLTLMLNGGTKVNPVYGQPMNDGLTDDRQKEVLRLASENPRDLNIAMDRIRQHPENAGAIVDAMYNQNFNTTVDSTATDQQVASANAGDKPRNPADPNPVDQGQGDNSQQTRTNPQTPVLTAAIQTSDTRPAPEDVSSSNWQKLSSSNNAPNQMGGFMNIIMGLITAILPKEIGEKLAGILGGAIGGDDQQQTGSNQQLASAQGQPNAPATTGNNPFATGNNLPATNGFSNFQGAHLLQADYSPSSDPMPRRGNFNLIRPDLLPNAPADMPAVQLAAAQTPAVDGRITMPMPENRGTSPAPAASGDQQRRPPQLQTFSA